MTIVKYAPRWAFAAIAATAAIAPAAASAEGFDGPYAGIQGGIGILKSEGSTLAGPFETSDSEAIVNGVLGYRTSLGDTGLVLGVEGDVGIGTDSGDARLGASAIAGIKLGESNLLYTRIGYGWRDGMPANTGDGLVLGGGFETRLSDNVGLRLDYKRLDLGGFNLPDNAASFTSHEVTGGVVFSF